MAVGDLWLSGSTPDGIYKSTDGGANWGSLISPPSGQTNVRGVAVDTRNGDLWLAGNSPDGIYKSTDGGANWGSIISGPSGQTDVLGIAIDSRNGDLWLAGSTPDGIYKSTDGGANWGSLISPPSGQTNVTGIAVDSRNGDLWLSGNVPDGIYKSTDGGANWGSIISGPSGQTVVTDIAVDTRNGDLWLAGNVPDGIYKSTDGGANWGSIISPPSGQRGVTGVEVEGGSPATLTAAITGETTRTTGQAASYSATLGGTATGATTYQWQWRSGTSGTWTDGPTTATYSLTQSSAGTWQVRLQATRQGASATSNVITTVWSAPVLPVAVAPTVSINAVAAGDEGTTVTLGASVGAGGQYDGSVSYAWSVSGGTLNDATAAAPVWTRPAVTSDTSYNINLRITVSGGGTTTRNGTSASRNALQVSSIVRDVPAPTVTVAVSVDDATPQTGESATWSRTVGGTATGAITQQWQRREGTTGAWSNVGTGTTYSTSRSSAGTWYVRCIVTRQGVSATSSAVLATWSAPVLPVAAAPTVSINAVAAGDEGTTVSLAATVAGGTYDGSIVYAWSVDEGTLNNATAASPTWTRPTVTATKNVDINLRITVSGTGTNARSGTSASRDATEVSASVRNVLPNASAGTASVAINAVAAGNEGTAVDLSATVTKGTGVYDTAAYAWTADEGTLTGADTSTPTWTRPTVTATKNVTLRLVLTLQGTGTTTASGTSVALAEVTRAASVLNVPDVAPPVLQSVATNDGGTLIALTYNEALDNSSIPTGSDFSFSPAKTISIFSVSGSVVTLSVSAAFMAGDTITLDYTAGTNPIQDLEGNDAPSFSGEAVTNNVQPPYQVFDLDADEYLVGSVSKRWLKDPRPLVNSNLCPPGQTRYLDLVVARREDDRGGVFHFEPVATGTRSNGHDLSTQVESSGVFRIDVGGNYFDFPVSSDSGGDEPYVIDFSGDTQTEFNTWRDDNLPNVGTVPATFTIWNGQGANPFTRPPELLRADIQLSGSRIALVFDEDLDVNSVPAGSDFTISPARTVSLVSVRAREVWLLINAVLNEPATVTVDYTPGTNPIQDIYGNDVAAFSGQPALFPSAEDTTPPTLSSVGTNEDGTKVILEFNEPINTASVPAASAFTLSPAKTITNVAITESICELTVSSAFSNTDTITVAYTAPTSNPLQDYSDNDVADIPATAVTNNVGLLPYTLDFPPTFVGSGAGNWSATIPAEYINSNTDQEVFIVVQDFFGTSRIEINVSAIGSIDFVDELESARLSIQNADGSVTYHSVVLSNVDSEDPYQLTIPAATRTAMTAASANLRLHWETAILQAQASLDGGLDGTIAATGQLGTPPVLQANASLAGGLSGTISSTSQLGTPPVLQDTASLTGGLSGDIAAAAQLGAAPPLRAPIGLTGGLSGDISADPTLRADGSLVGGLSGDISADSTLRVDGSLAGGLSGAISATGRLTTAAALRAVADLTVGLSGGIGASGQLGDIPPLQSSIALAGGLSGTIASTAQLGASPPLRAPVGLTGGLSGDISADSILRADGSLTGGLSGDISADPTLRADGSLAGGLSGDISATGRLTTANPVRGVADLTVGLSGTIGASGQLGDIPPLQSSIDLSGGLGGTIAATGQLTTANPVRGVAGLTGGLSGSIASTSRLGTPPPTQATASLAGGLAGSIGATSQLGTPPSVQATASLAGGLVGGVVSTGQLDTGLRLRWTAGTPTVADSDGDDIRVRWNFTGVPVVSALIDGGGTAFLGRVQLRSRSDSGGSNQLVRVWLKATDTQGVAVAGPEFIPALESDWEFLFSYDDSGGNRQSVTLTSEDFGSDSSEPYTWTGTSDTDIPEFRSLILGLNAGSNYSFQFQLNPLREAASFTVGLDGAISATGQLGDIPPLRSPVSLIGGLAGTLASDSVLRARADLEGELAGSIASDPILRADGALAGGLSGTVSATAQLTTANPVRGVASLTGGLAGSSSATGQLSDTPPLKVTIGLTGGLSGSVAATGQLGAIPILRASAPLTVGLSGAISATGRLTTAAALQAEADLTVGLSGSIGASGRLGGTPDPVRGSAPLSVGVSGGIGATGRLGGTANPIRKSISIAGGLAGAIGATGELGGVPDPLVSSARLAGGLSGFIGATGRLGLLPVVADAGDFRIVDTGDTVQLDGSGSSSGDGSPITYSWQQISGPPVTFDDRTLVRPTFTAPAATGSIFDVDGDTEGTLEAWFKLVGDDRNAAIASRKNNLIGTGKGFALYVDSSNHVSGVIADGNRKVVVADDTAINDGQWHYAAIVFDRDDDQIHLYVDGSLAGSEDISAVGDTTTTNAFRVGATHNGGNRLIGEVDDVRFWSVARTAEQLEDCKDKEISGAEFVEELLAYWKFNESAGLNAADSANNFDLTLTGSANFIAGHSGLVPTGVAKHFTPDDIVEGSLRLSSKSKSKSPSVVQITYTDKSTNEWITARQEAAAVGVNEGTVPRRLSRVSLPGIHSAPQAKREAIERVNWYTLSDLNVAFTTFDPGLELQLGAIIAVTHPIGLDGALFRITNLGTQQSRWSIEAVRHDPAIYSDEVVADPTYSATSLGNPLNPPGVTDLSAAEELFNYKSGLTGSRVRVEWNNEYPFTTNVLVEGYVSGNRVWQSLISPGVTEAVSPPVEELVTDTAVAYEVRVTLQTPFAEGDIQTVTVDILGKLAPPSDVPEISSTYLNANTVEVLWGAATDIDVWRYELRQGDSSDDWDDATTIDLIDGLSHVVADLTEGTTRFFVKAVDTVGNRSVNAVHVDVVARRPNAPTNFRLIEVAGTIRAFWDRNAASEYVESYKLTFSDTGGGEEEVLAIIDSDRVTSQDANVGTHLFKLYATNAIGDSVGFASITREVTSDIGAFLADRYDFTNPTLTNMYEYRFRDWETTGEIYYVTASDSLDPFSSGGPPHSFSRETEHLINFHSSVNGTYLSEVRDFRALLTGDWIADYKAEVLDGAACFMIELSVDGTNWDTFVGQSAQGEYQYVRIRIVTMGHSTVKLTAPISVSLVVAPREETGSGTSSDSVFDRQVLRNQYTFLKNVAIHPQARVPLIPVVDNVNVGPKTGIRNNGSAYLDAGDLAELNFGDTDSFSVECWIRHSGSSNNNRVIVGKRGTSAGWALRADEGNGAVDIVLDSNTTTTHSIANSLPNDGESHHIAFTVDRGNNQLRVWADGAEVGSARNISGHTGSFASTAPFRVFADANGGNVWGGAITELRVWEGVRTASQVEDNYNLEVDYNSRDLVGYWRFNGHSDEVVADVDDETRYPDVTGDLNKAGTGTPTYIVMNDTAPKRVSFDVLIFDTDGNQVSVPYEYTSQGV